MSDLEILLYQKSFIISSRPERSQESAICKSRQEMFNYLGVHELVVKLLKDGMHTLEFLHEQGLEMPMKKLGDLFSRCHRLLQSFVHHNPKNQKCLYKYLHIFLQYLKLDAGQIPLICEIYKNNTKLISKLTLDCFKPFKNLIYQSGRQPVFLDFFEVILKVKGNYLQETQRLVINIFVDEEIDRFLLYMNNEKESDFVFTEGNRNRNYKDVPFEYHSRLIQILSKCGIGVNGMYMTEAKCQKIIPLKIVFKILTLCDVSSQFEMLRIPLIEFLFNNYLDCEKLYDEMKIASDFFIYTNVQAQKLEEIELISSDYLKFLKIFVKCLNKYCESFLSVCDITSNKEDYISLQRFAYILSRNDHKFMNIKLENGLISEIQLLCLKFNYELPVIKHEYISTADSNDYSLSDENIEECKDTVGEY